MRLTLTRHPDTSCAALERINIELTRLSSDEAIFRYVAEGDITAIALPPQKASIRADDLWRRTCFEAFLRPPYGETYYEFNFAPSTEWAAYHFKRYRESMQPVEDITAPQIEVATTANRLEMRVALTFKCLSALRSDMPLNLSLAAVIEETNGDVSYWALEHPPGKPDFHHPDCFAARLSPVN